MKQIKPHLMRKLKIFALVGFVGVLITGVLTIWVGMRVFNYVVYKATEAVHSPMVQTNIEDLKTEFRNLPKPHVLNCWGKAQSLMAIHPWLERPALDNLVDLKLACLEGRPANCNGHECTDMKNLIQTSEGSAI